MTEPNDSRRLELVTAAQRQWTDALTDLGGRNTLLYYKDRRAGTLDLALADPDAVERFEKAGHARLSKLFPGHELAEERADAIRRMQAIYRKARELQEERGIQAGYLATGMARWDELFLEPAAPVLLRRLTITPTRARYDDFELVLDEETEVNPVLLHKLATVYDATIDKPHPERIGAQLARSALLAEIPGFAIQRRKVIGTFTYAKLPMVRDLEAAGDLLADSDLVAAIAGDAEAQELVSADLVVSAPREGNLSYPPPEDPGSSPGMANASAGDSDDPADDFSVLDADSSQRAAIDAVLAGRSLVIHGPPGTGKSQTIANLIAAMVARGRKVLFVAEKRAAIDAVLSRLTAVGLADLVLDIHEGARDRQRICADLGETLDRAEHASDPDTSALHRRLTDRQRRLRRHSDALHRAHAPWGLSPYQVQSALLGIPDTARGTTRIAEPERISPLLAESLRDELREFTRLGGFEVRPGSTPWFGAALADRAAARRAVELARVLSSRSLPRLATRLAIACSQLGLPPAADFDHPKRTRLLALLNLLHAIEQPGSGFRERRAMRKEARAQWESLGGAGIPVLPDSYPELARAWDEGCAQLAELQALVPLAGVEVDPEGAVAALAADEETPWKLPRLHDLARRFSALGLGPVLDEVAGTAEVTPDLVVGAFDHAWYQAILEEIRVRDPDYAADTGTALDEVAEDFRRRDVEHLGANRARVRGAWARQLRDGVDRHPLQARVIRKQAALRRGHLPLRRLLDQAGDVLFALKPCWAMSPLMVSQVLPLSRLFDLVIFDEASQVVPADAIGSMIRAHQVVVAGDDRQLPPTSFFRQTEAIGPADDDEAEDEAVSLSAGFESILDALRPLLPTCPLTWHYRSRDERLVAFSNERIYGGALTTFPGVWRDDCLRHVVVDPAAAPSSAISGQSGQSGEDASAAAEVTEVVRLILEHARVRPGESLGVIALGLRHAERIDLALRAALAAPGAGSAVEAFFAEDAPEPFFVKNLERVQGDERDAIILSVGYGKHPDGRMRYQWGPLLRDGGERRLNVAATRARQRLTVVSSFSSHDVDPGRLTKAGARMLAEYLEYAGSGGVSAATEAAAAGPGGLGAPGAPGAPGTSGGPGSAGDPFSADVAVRLAAAGIVVVPRYGVGGYRVDFAAAHPDDPARMILAIEADGVGYRNSGSVRDRDRLRKEHLERLGWRVHRLWSTSWFADPRGELARLRAAYEDAVAASPKPPPAPAPEPDPAPEPASAPEPAPAAEPASSPAASAPGPSPASARAQASPPDEGAAAPDAITTRGPAALPVAGSRRAVSAPDDRALPPALPPAR